VVSLHDCLALFCDPEEMIGTNEVPCSRCKTSEPHERTCQITRAPLYLAGMLTQGGQGGRPAPLASRLHGIPTYSY
jgi:hypothetical protein